MTPEQLDGWRDAVDAVHAAGSRIVLQLMHAGALVQGNHHRTYSIAPSAVAPKGTKMAAYGGDVRNRARLATEVVSAVRTAVGTDFVLGIRLSQTKVNDPDYRWPGGIAEAATIFGSLAEAGVDYLHSAGEGRDWSEAGTLDGGTVITRLARDVTGLPIIANGGMHDADLARSVLGAGDAVLKPDVTLDSQISWERARGHGRPLGRP